VIVTGPQGGRQEVDLAVPQPKSELPEPLCPAGAVASGFVEQEDRHRERRRWMRVYAGSPSRSSRSKEVLHEGHCLRLVQTCKQLNIGETRFRQLRAWRVWTSVWRKLPSVCASSRERCDTGYRCFVQQVLRRHCWVDRLPRKLRGR
jgi:hypothetical protein